MSGDRGIVCIMLDVDWLCPDNEVLRRKSWVIAMPILANARLVLSHAKKVLSRAK
jgi:hypothetical protein